MWQFKLVVIERRQRFGRWGFDIVEGEVVDAYDSGFGKRVVVSVTFEAVMSL